MVPAPPVRRRLVGRTLRRYRENLGYSLGDAARILECDASKISRIETGQRGIRGKELRELLGEYGIEGTRRATDLRLARLTRSVRRLVIRTYSATFRLRGPGCRLTLRQAAVR